MTAALLLLAALASAAPAPKTPRVVTLKTADGWTLTADERPAAKGGAWVVLAHGVGSSRGEWERLAVRLQAAGVGTLALDLRGHHDSLKGPKGAGDFRTFDATGEWPRAVEDLLAGARYLEAHGVPEGRIGFGGASIGANLAARAATHSPKTPFLVLLSAGPDYRGVPLAMRAGVKTLAGAAVNDPYAYQALGRLSTLGGVETFQTDFGHGVQMFDDKPTLDKVVAWVVAASKPPAKPKAPAR
ncbi:MAG: alpha/beta fold hydrolase [Elusimicrobia bacterium]|nr:alpha/beta fold hydrolase [Elusimicrobiota bacterium]